MGGLPKLCDYRWGPDHDQHACDREPGHEGAHECSCGASRLPL